MQDYDEQTDHRLTVITNASLGNNIEDETFQHGYAVFLDDNLIAWNSNKIKTVVDSSCDAEYTGMHEEAKEAKFIKQMLEELGFKIGYINLGVNNQSALTLASHSTQHQKTKHIDIMYHILREWTRTKLLKINYINTRDNIADIFTKTFDPKIFKTLKDLLGIKQELRGV